MSLRINTNIAAMNTHRSLTHNALMLSKSMEKLSSGLRINRASDDAAGLSISETLRAQVKGLGQAEKNSQDGISLINTAEGGLNEIHAILQRMRELAVQASNGTLTTSDRSAINAEVQSLMSEVDNISSYTTFNTLTILQAANTFTFQVGADKGQNLMVTTTGVTTGALTLTGMQVSTQQGATLAIASLDAAITAVSTVRSRLGAASNRLEHTINNINVGRENLASAESRIRDVDMAFEMTKLTRNQIMLQSATAMLAQANAQPNSVLSLLK